MALVNLLGSTTRVETPYVSVKIGDYTLGVYNRSVESISNTREESFQYPNYIQKLTVTKINGKVNVYSLDISYAITENKDPNFIAKILSSVSDTRRITFSYGDMSMPSYIYREEKAIITKITSDTSFTSAVISYNIKAVSTGLLGTSTALNHEALYNTKPSDKIKQMLQENSRYGLLDIFYGMKNLPTTEINKLIPGNDKPVDIEYQSNMTSLDYLSYLVSCMIPNYSPSNSASNVYTLVFRDDASYYTIGNNNNQRYEYGGPYFKIESTLKTDNEDVYEIDIGYPSDNIVTNYRATDDQTYAIFYKYANKLNTAEFVQRLNDEGEIEYIYSPAISSNNANYITRANDLTWWSQVTSFPISSTITIKGLLRPAVLMTHVRLNILFFGKRYIDSGLYIITKQVDEIDSRGYRTTLSLTRVGEDSPGLIKNS